MPSDSFSIVRLTVADCAAYKAFFAAGAAAHPDTLRITPADMATSPFSTAPTADAVTLAAVTSNGAWLGVVALEREHGREKRRHIAWLVRMYVPADHAGRGLGRALLRAAIQKARLMPGIAKLNLTVAAHNERAVRLYESEGFRTFAREDDALRDEAPRTELSMSLVL